MTRVYGRRIEPGGMEYDDERELTMCPACYLPDAGGLNH